MIYEILVADIPRAFESGAQLIIISGDSQHALVRNEQLDIEFLESYPDSQLKEILADLKWRQPCKDCEV